MPRWFGANRIASVAFVERFHVNPAPATPAGDARVSQVKDNAKLLKAGVGEGEHKSFSPDKLQRLSEIIGKSYSRAGLSVTDADARYLLSRRHPRAGS